MVGRQQQVTGGCTSAVTKKGVEGRRGGGGGGGQLSCRMGMLLSLKAALLIKAQALGALLSTTFKC